MIRLHHISKHYVNGDVVVKALQNVNLQIDKGEFLAIMGPSGSGKSTLMNILGCLDIPTEGDYILNRKKVNQLNQVELARLRNQEIGFIFQTFHLLSRMTVLKNVEIPMMYNGLKKRERRERAVHLLNQVGLGDRLTYKPNQLSGGQRQRVAIARALANHPSIILADEPTGNLDSRTSYEIMDILKHLNQQGTTIVLVTHEDDIATYASRIITCHDGQIIKEVNG